MIQWACRLLARQPDWSLLTVIILDGWYSRNPLLPACPPGLLRSLRGSIILARPVRPITLVNILDSALEARRRQCQIRDLLARQAEDVRHRDQFLVMLGHELCNPLAAIRNLLDVFHLERDNLPEHLHQALDMMSGQAQHLNHLINELLDVARVTQGRITLRREPPGVGIPGHRPIRT